MNDTEVIYEAVAAVLRENAHAMQADGGGAVIDKIEESVVYISMLGACQFCPSKPLTISITLEPSFLNVLPAGYKVKFT